VLSKGMQKMKDDIIRISFYITALHVTAFYGFHTMERNNRSFLQQSGEHISWYFKISDPLFNITVMFKLQNAMTQCK